MLPGLLTTIILPLMIQAFGVGENARGIWLHMMGLISLVAISAVLVEYYFTKERITEDHAKTEDAKAESSVPFMVIVLLNPHNLLIVLVGLVIKSFGALPTYLMTAFLAEALDHIEWKNHFRADGFAASITTIVVTVGTGLAQTVILGGIDAFGYIAPTSNMDTEAYSALWQKL